MHDRIEYELPRQKTKTETTTIRGLCAQGTLDPLPIACPILWGCDGLIGSVYFRQNAGPRGTGSRKCAVAPV